MVLFRDLGLRYEGGMVVLGLGIQGLGFRAWV